MKQKLLQWEKIILDLLFPQVCLGCDKPKTIFCRDCLKRIDYLSFQVCPFCEKAITESGKICHVCQQKSLTKLNQLIVSASYQDKLLTHAIHLYKYRFVSSLATPLARIMIKTISKSILPLPDLIIPVPLHPRRLRWRGFNQAQLLADEISQNSAPGINFPVRSDILIRSRYTPPQMKIRNYQARQQNIHGAFTLTPDVKINPGQKILLVDDICTTGATLLECANQLQKLSPKSISAIVLARQNTFT